MSGHLNTNASRGRVRTTLVWTGGLLTATLATVEVSRWALATLRTSYLLAMSAVFLAAAASAQATPQQDEIVKVADAYRRAVLAGDPRAVAATYSEDGVELPPHHPLVRGRTAIEQRFRGLFGSAQVTMFTFTHLETSVDGDLAYDAGTYEQRLMLPSGQAVNDTGKYIAILKRAQRTWKAAYITYNSNLPAPPCSPRP